MFKFRSLLWVIVLCIVGCDTTSNAPSVAGTPTSAPSAPVAMPTAAPQSAPTPTRTAPPSPSPAAVVVPAPPTTAAILVPQPTKASDALLNPTARMQEFPVPARTRPHDIAPAPDGAVWYTAQGSGELGRLDPQTGESKLIPLGQGSAPHGVIVGPDGAAWVTDGGLNAIVRVDPRTLEVKRFNLPANRGNANLNTAAFDGKGIHWFTGQNGIYGRLDPQSGKMDVYDAPRGRGPYGITTTPSGGIFYASLAGSYVGQIDIATGNVTVLEPPTKNQGARRVWSDSTGRIWVSEWNSGNVSVYDPANKAWKQWRLPGSNPQTYAVYVDDQDIVWLSDFGANSIVRFNPKTEKFTSFPFAQNGANVRQILGRPGEVWGAESGTSKLVVIRTAGIAD